MTRLRSLPVLRSAAALSAACAVVVTVAACGTSTKLAAGATAKSTATVRSSTPAVAPPAAAPATATTASTPNSAPPSTSSALAPSSAPASAAASSAPATASNQCGSAAGYLPGSSITVCPAQAPVGAVVHITVQGCTPVGTGLPLQAAAGLFFLGPGSWLGTDGGGGADVPLSPPMGSTEATAAFTIPATYIGGTESTIYPTITTKPGTGYTFATDPAGECDFHFTVTAS